MNNIFNEKQLRIKEIVDKNRYMLDKYSDSIRLHFMDSISEKSMVKIVKNIDSLMATTAFIAFIDTTLTHCHKEGIVIMEEGLYVKDIFDRYYINYKDITRCYVRANKDELIMIRQ